MLTPDTDKLESKKKQAFYREHLKEKGVEVADACMETLSLLDTID